MVGGVVSARLLLPEGKGELAAIILWPTLLASLGSFGIFEAATYFSANGPDRGARVWPAGLVIAVALSAVLMPLGYFMVPHVLAGYGPEVIRTGRLYLAFIPLNLITLVLMALLLGRMRFQAFNGLRSMLAVLTAIGMMAFWLLGFVSVAAFALSSLLAIAATLVVAYGMLHRMGWISWTADVATIRRLLGYGVQTHSGAVASMLNLRLDQALMSMLVAPSVLGLYVVAANLSSVVALGAGAVAFVTLPLLANPQSTDARRADALGQHLRLATLLAVVPAAILFASCAWVVRTFFGESFLGAVPIARILVVAAVPTAWSMVLSAAFKAANRPLIASLAQFISLSVTAVGLWLLLPRYQGLGAAWTSLLAYSTTGGYLLWSAQRTLAVPLPSVFVPRKDDWLALTAASRRALETVSGMAGFSHVK